MKKRRYESTFSLSASLVLVAMLTLAYWRVWIAYYAEEIIEPFWTKGHFMILFIYIVLLTVLTNIYGGKSIAANRIWDVIYAHSLSLAIANIITYFQICLLAYSLPNAVPMVFLSLGGFMLTALWAVGVKVFYRRRFPPRNLLVAYDDYSPDGLIKKLCRLDDQYKIGGKMRIDGDLDSLFEELKKYDGMVICDVHAAHKSDIVKYCYENDIPLFISPKLSDIIIRGAENSTAIDTPVLICHNRGLRPEQRVLKRCFDLFMILPLAVLFSPFMLLSALAIKLHDGGSVFYKQPRLTLDGKIFMIYKFRSMRADAEHGKAQLARKNDDRVTPVGRLLRATHFDETPQIFNIIKGEMSIVGPRPERPEIAEEYANEIPEFGYRLKTKAGLTGYAQVFGKYNTTPYDKLKLDLFYIHNQSFLLDIELVLKTVKIIFERENTEGIEDGQRTASSHNKKE